MSNYNAFDPLSVCFNIMKMKYSAYDESLSSKNFLNPYDKVNVFINLESVYKNLSMIMDIEKKIIITRDFENIIISNILNLAAHYKRFFVDNGLDTKVYLYNTDFSSDEFDQFKYNEEYRSYYLLKFTQNPKFILLTEKLQGTILPDVKTFCEFIPNVYYISAKNIEGSLVPYIIAQSDPTRKNLIVGGEFFDTQYSNIPNFVNHYIYRTYNNNAIYSSTESYIKGIMKTDTIDEEFTSIFHNYSMYCTVMSVLGNRERSIEKLMGIGPKTLAKNLALGLENDVIELNTSSPEIICEIFEDENTQNEFINNFYCSSVLSMYDELTVAEKTSIMNQISDRVDKETIQKINATKFHNHPLYLDGLL